MKKFSARVALFTAALLAVGGSVAVLTASPASAHGAMMKPGSRSYFCWQDAITSSGALSPTNSACAAAINKGGQGMIYNWFAVLRSNAGGKMGSSYIADGSICSGGSPASDAPYDMSGLNITSADWPVTHLTSGGSFDWWYSNWAAHPGTWKLYVTKDVYDPTTPLKWSDLESEPFLSVTNPPQQGSVGSDSGHYYWTGNLPSGKSGRHLIYSQWIRSDSNENFFGCSDVVFDGGNGEVTGIRGTSSGGGTTTTTRPTTTTTRPTTTTTTRGGGGTTTTTTSTTSSRPTTTTTTGNGGGGNSTCQVTYTPNQWTGGFTADVKVASTVAINGGWTVKWTYPGDTKVTNAWNASVSQSGNAVTATNLAWNNNIPAGGSTSFGFQGTWSSNNAAPTDFSVNGASCNGTGGGGGSTTSSTTTTTRPNTTTTTTTRGGGTTTTTSRTTTTTTTTGGGGNASALNDGFESQSAGTVGGGWVTHPQKTCDSGNDGSGSVTGTASIDDSTAHSGSKSLKVVGLAQFCQHMLVKAPVNLANVGSNVFVRTWFKHSTAFTASHVTFMAMTDSGDNADIRIGAQGNGGSGVLMWNREKSDAAAPPMSPQGIASSVQIPANTWICMEYEVNSSGAQTWINGSQVSGLTIGGSNSPFGSWSPKVTDLRLGWESYGSAGDTFWFDDVAVSNSKIGC
jgi:chitin-binding protein